MDKKLSGKRPAAKPTKPKKQLLRIKVVAKQKFQKEYQDFWLNYT